MVGHDSSRHRQPQSRPTIFTGGEWFKEPSQDLVGNSRAFIPYAHLDSMLRFVCRSFQPESSATWHRFQTVQQQVHKHLMELFGVGVNKGDRFVVSVQTHDQVGNRALGERLGQLVPFNCQRFSAALMLLAPYLPMLFMGEEYGETHPFPFFCDFGDESLREAVQAGRRREFAEFPWPYRIPDPLAESTYTSAKLSWAWLGDSQKDCLRQLYRDLLNVRRQWPALRDFQHREAELVQAAHGETLLKITRGTAVRPGEQIEAYFNPGPTTAIVACLSRPRDEILLSTEDLKYGGWKRSVTLSWDLSPFECIVIRRGQKGTK